MTTANTDLHIPRGDRTYLDVALQNTDRAAISAATFQFTAKLFPNDPDSLPVLSKTSVAGISLQPDPAVAITIQLDAADTKFLPWPQYRHLFYDVQMTPNDGSGPFTVACGVLLLDADITRP